MFQSHELCLHFLTTPTFFYLTKIIARILSFIQDKNNENWLNTIGDIYIQKFVFCYISTYKTENSMTSTFLGATLSPQLTPPASGGGRGITYAFQVAEWKSYFERTSGTKR